MVQRLAPLMIGSKAPKIKPDISAGRVRPKQEDCCVLRKPGADTENAGDDPAYCRINSTMTLSNGKGVSPEY
jgi:hypothetical protein